MSETVTISKFDETFVRIDADRAILRELWDKFSFTVEGAEFMPAVRNKMWDGKKRLFNLKTNTLYLGLHPYVKEFCDKNGYECVYEDPLDVERPFSVDEFRRMVAALDLSTMTDEGRVKITPHDFQEAAVIHTIQAGRTLLLSPTSSGKSLIIYLLLRYYLAKCKRKILIVVPNTLLVRQLFDDFVDYAALINWEPEDHIHLLYDGGEKYTDKRVTITTWQAIAVKEKLPKDLRAQMSASQIKAWNRKAAYVLDQDYFDEFDVVFGDECHLFAATELSEIMTKLRNAKYRFGTTGTIKDTKSHRMILEGLFGAFYQTTTTRALMDDKKVADLLIECIQLQYTDEERKAMRKATYPEEMDFLLEHDQRNRFIRNLALSLQGNTLVLFERVEQHGHVLFDMIQKKAAAGRKIFYVHGKVPTDDRNEIRKITEGEKDAIIIASYGTFSAGVSIRNLDNLIFSSPTKAKIRVFQSIGRGLRMSKRKTKVTLFDIADDLSCWNKAGTQCRDNYSLQHFTERLNLYNTEQFTYKLHRVALDA